MVKTATVIARKVEEARAAIDPADRHLAKREARLRKWEKIQRTFAATGDLAGLDMETPEGLLCLLDGQRVPFLERYILEKYRLAHEEYRSLFAGAANAPVFSRMYLRAFQLEAIGEAAAAKLAVRAEDSIEETFLVDLLNGRKGSLLGPHYLKSKHGLTRVEYLERCGLPPDYPTMSSLHERFKLHAGFPAVVKPGFWPPEPPLTPEQLARREARRLRRQQRRATAA